MRKKGLAPWEQKEYEALIERISAGEQRIAALDARLADPALWSGPRAASREVEAERLERGRELAELYLRWEELESRRA